MTFTGFSCACKGGEVGTFGVCAALHLHPLHAQFVIINTAAELTITTEENTIKVISDISILVDLR